MKRFLCVGLLSALSAASIACAAQAGSTEMAAEKQIVTTGENRTSFTGQDQYFTGKVKVDMLFSPVRELPASGAYVTFDAGARSAWHTHPAGQTLIVTSGRGLTQQWGGPSVEIRPGDVVRCPAGVKHWHGAASDSSMTHLAITPEVNGKNVEWMEKVTDEQYSGAYRQAESGGKR